MIFSYIEKRIYEIFKHLRFIFHTIFTLVLLSNFSLSFSDEFSMFIGFLEVEGNLKYFMNYCFFLKLVQSQKLSHVS